MGTGPSLADPYERAIEWIHLRRECTGVQDEITHGFAGTLCHATLTSVIGRLLFKPYSSHYACFNDPLSPTGCDYQKDV